MLSFWGTLYLDRATDMMEFLDGKRSTLAIKKYLAGYPLITLITAGVIFYLASILVDSPTGFLQVTFNGIGIGAIYALVALGFTLVYGTVWFFDLTYGVMIAIGGYTVFYLAGSQVQNLGRGAINNPYLNVFFGILIAGVVGWALYTWRYRRLRSRINRNALLGIGGLLALGAGAYTTIFLGAERANLHIYLSPLVGVLAALIIGLVFYRLLRLIPGRSLVWGLLATLSVIVTLTVGSFSGFLVARTPDANLYLTWLIGPLLAGALSLAIYRGIFVHIIGATRSNLGVLVGSLGLLLALTAFISVIFSPAGKALPDPFGSDSWEIAGAFIKPFTIFVIVAVFMVFAGVLALLKKSNFGKAMRAISDDAEVAEIVGINTTAVISIVFFMAAAVAALAGIFFGEDSAIKPTFGFVLLLKGWVAAVVGGLGNIYGALLGGFVLGLVENYGIWYLAAEWKTTIAFSALIFVLLFWPTGLLPRK